VTQGSYKKRNPEDVVHKCRVCGYEATNWTDFKKHVTRWTKYHPTLEKYYIRYMKNDGEGICAIDGCNNETEFITINGDKSYKLYCNEHFPKHVQIRTDEEIEHNKKVCQICGKENIKKIGGHTYLCHKITAKEYYDKYLTKYEDEKICSVCGRDVTFTGRVTAGYYRTCTHLGVCAKLDKEYKKKQKSVSLKKYGVDNPAKSPVIIEKIKRSTKENKDKELRRLKLKLSKPNIYVLNIKEFADKHDIIESKRKNSKEELECIIKEVDDDNSELECSDSNGIIIKKSIKKDKTIFNFGKF